MSASASDLTSGVKGSTLAAHTRFKESAKWRDRAARRAMAMALLLLLLLVSSSSSCYSKIALPVLLVLSP